MIKFKNRFFIFKGISGLLLSTIVTISSCSKDHDKDEQYGPARLMVVNGSPGPQKYFLKANGVNVNAEALSFSASQPYTQVSAGSADLSISDEGITGVVSQTTTQFAAATSYSAYIANVPEKAELIVMKDDFSAPVEGKAKIRFVNMSPDAGNLDLLINGKPAPALTNVKFGGFTSFISVDASASVNFQIKASGQTDTLVTVPKVSIGANKFYTLWAKGGKSSLAGSGNAPLALGVINNK